MTSHDAMLNSLLDALEDSAAGYAYVAEEADDFGFYSLCAYQAFERRRLATLLGARMAAHGSVDRPRKANAGLMDKNLVQIRVALGHGHEAVIGQLRRSDSRLTYMVQAALVDGQLTGEIARAVRSIASSIGDAQAELSAAGSHVHFAPFGEIRQVA